MKKRDSGQHPHMYFYEEEVRKAIDANQAVHYKVTPDHEGNHVVPVTFHMQARGMAEGRGEDIEFDDETPNTTYGLNDRRFHNLSSEVPEGYVK